MTLEHFSLTHNERESNSRIINNSKDSITVNEQLDCDNTNDNALLSKKRSKETFTAIDINFNNNFPQMECCALTSEQEKQWNDICELIKLENEKYAQAYLHLSFILEQHTDCALWHCLLSSVRAWCSYKLCNYDLCMEDCKLYLSSMERIEELHRCDNAIILVSTLNVHKMFIVCLVIGEHYEEAVVTITQAHTLLERLQQCKLVSQQTETFASLRDDLVNMSLCLESLRHIRLCAKACNWNKAQLYLSTAQWYFTHTTLCTVQAKVLYECKELSAARKLLLSFLPTLPSPLTAEEVNNVNKEIRELCVKSSSEYLRASALLAKISYYMGRPYINITAVLINRCLQISPFHAMLIELANRLLEYEDVFTEIYNLCTYREYDKLISCLNHALRIDASNDNYNALLYRYLAEVQYKRLCYEETVNACNESLARCADMAEVYYLRSNAYAKLQQHEKSKSDLTKVTVMTKSTPESLVQQQKLCPLLDHFGNAKSDSLPTVSSSNRSAYGRPLQKYVHPRSAAHEFNVKSTSQSLRQLIISQMCHARTLYELLGVKSSASLPEISQAFRRRALIVHPDRVIDASENERRLAEKMFKRLNEAHCTLCDAVQRHEYDKEKNNA